MIFHGLGSMQGRLSQPLNDKIQHFPITKWQEEFHTASKIGLSSIEWVYEFEKVKKILWIN